MAVGLLYADGASRGNPGPAGIGVVLCDQKGNTIAEVSEHIGRATNNVAEYKALIRGLEEALSRGITRLGVLVDSQLLARQLSGEYRVRAPHLAKLYSRATHLIEQFEQVWVVPLPRGGNLRADALAKKAAVSPKARPSRSPRR